MSVLPRPDPLDVTPRDPEPARPSGLLYALLLAALFIAGLVLGFGAGWVTTPQRSAPATSAEPRSVVAPATQAPTPRASQPTETGAPTPEPSPTLGVVVTGVATFYCNYDASRGPESPCTNNITDGPGRDLFAAAGPPLRVGDWRNRTVFVFGPAGFTIVEIIDFCQCPGRLIDLYADAFETVCGPLSMGVCEVSVTW